ncbi:dynamin family protein [Diplodia corticola]|uniref:Dynamin family protein n=1 Tax=Diplodia corticola TaxID=236234 RepID=A0A1J9QS59_9PEZI|nr:dynamin family protein [Diplodia corticola]OJD31257.1 dynamin family protein [Diplodia corticola]
MARTTSALADPSMLSKIDRLFACNVGHHIALPQIVVVGDQSSGKSSVLEGLTRLPFPRDSGLCTRFATQISFRRSPTPSVSVSVLPGKDASEDHINAVRAWKKTNLPVIDQPAFAAIMREVQDVMGIDRTKTFSSDVLSIEVAGPDQEHLTVIDVPGIFQRVTKDVTTKEDKEFVKDMVLAYMKNPRSVMLTVVPANVDVATQLILEMAEEVDPDGQRTLGVLTKPDLVDKGAERTVADMVEGRSHQLKLGWCIVKNPGQQDILNPAFDRYTEETTFFKTVAPWSSLPMDRLGVGALRERLQAILAAHIRREFPKVKLELNGKLKAVKKALEQIGPARETPADQSSYLIDIATRFQDLATQALEAKYVDDYFACEKLRIATIVVARNETLSGDFDRFGHTFQFDAGGEEDDNDDSQENPHSSDTDKVDGEEVKVDGGCSRRVESDGHDNGLSDLLHENTELAIPKQSDILRWLMDTFMKSRGFELGNFDPSLLATTMKAQTQKWDCLAMGYISDVACLTDAFINNLLRHVCPDDDTYHRLSVRLADRLLGRYNKAFQQVQFILDVERKGTPVTLNHYFNDNLEKCRQKRMREMAAAKSTKDDYGNAVVRVDDLVQTHSMSNKEHTVQDLHDILKSYYKVARKRVVDNLVMQGAMYRLISGPKTPLKLFSPAFVSQMSPEQLEEVAGEEPSVKSRRAQLLKEQEDLEKGRRILV